MWANDNHMVILRKVSMTVNFLACFLGAVYVIALLVGQTRIFIKAHEPWWKALIPIYGGYVLHKVSGCTDVFWGTLGMNVGYVLLSRFVAPVIGLSIFTAVIYLGIIVALRISLCSNLAKSFTRDNRFAAGLFFLEPVFMLILGFGNATHTNGIASGGIDWNCQCGYLNAAHKLHCDNCKSIKP